MVLGCRDPYFIVLYGRYPYSSRVYLTVFHAVGMNGVACRHEMVAREGVVTDHVTSHRGGNTSHRGGNVLTAVGMFSPRWECSHRGGNVSTSVGMFPPW